MISALSPQTYSTKMQSDPKDSIINQLKTKIFDLEQNARDYTSLQTKCKQLANENSILNEEKMRLEYELKQKTETTNKIISDLNTEVENLKNALNEQQIKLYLMIIIILFASLELKR